MWVCRLPVHIDHAERAVFYETLRRIRDFPMGRQSRRPLQQHCSSCRGARLCPPAGYICFTEIFGKIATSLRADRVVGPYRVSANPYYPANSERRAFLPQPFKGYCLQIWRAVTGGAYHSA